MYRKIIEKSRAVWLKKPAAARMDIFLLLSAMTLAVFVFANQSFTKIVVPRRTTLFIPGQCANIFGKGLMENLIAEFEEQNPELKIETADSGSADILFFDGEQLSAGLREGSLLSLKPWLHAETETEQWAVPLVSFMDLFFYNIDILKAANFDRPPKTRLDILLYARAVTNKAAGISGTALGLSPGDPAALRRELYSWIWAAGTDIGPAETGAKTGVPKAADSIISFFAQMKAEGLIAPGSFDKTGADILDEFMQRKTAMITSSARELSMLKKRMGPALGVTSIPAATLPGKNRAGLSSIYAGLSAECMHPDNAWTFLSFLAAHGPSLAAALEAVPGSLSTLSSGIGIITDDAVLLKAWEIFEAADIVEGFPGNPPGPELEQLLREKLAAALAEKDEQR